MRATDGPIEIMDRTRVTFLLDNSSIEVFIRDGKLRVMGDDDIVVHPDASNVVNITSRT